MPAAAEAEVVVAEVSEPLDISHLKGELDVRRKMFIARGAVSDLKDDCIVAHDKDFDVSHSIFSVLSPRIQAAMAKNQTKPYWSDGAITRAEKEYAAKVTPPPEERMELLQFLARTLEDTSMEHADGSFMDHLTFGRDYCAEHWPEVSPTPLLIHSVMGVGTNIFPMNAKHIPELQSLLGPDEWPHVQAFPSILRLLSNYTLHDALRTNLHRKPHLQGISFHRLIDNKPISLTAEELWVTLNYHLIHWMDFLPVAEWEKHAASLQQFSSLHHLLREAGELRVKIDLDLTGAEGVSLAAVVAGEEEHFVHARQGSAAFQAERSGVIGHSLDFELHWAEPRL